MAKKKAGPVIGFDVGVKNRKPYRVTCDAYNLGATYDNAHLKFFLRGELVFSVAGQKWDYVQRVTPVPETPIGVDRD